MSMLLIPSSQGFGLPNEALVAQQPPGDPQPGQPNEPGVPVQPNEPGEPTIPDQPPPAPVA